MPPEELIHMEALRLVTRANERHIAEHTVWETLGVLALAGEELSQDQLADMNDRQPELGLWREDTTDQILELAATLTACETPIKGLAAALKRFDRMQGVELIAFKPGRLVASCNYVRPDNRDAAEQPFECDFSFKAKIELVRLMVAAGATHVDASEAPERLRFSHDGETPDYPNGGWAGRWTSVTGGKRVAQI